METTHIFIAQREPIDTRGMKLHALIVELMKHRRAVALLSGGLRLTWDRFGDEAKFGLTRVSPKAPGAKEIETVVNQARPDLYLDNKTGAWTETVIDPKGNKSAKWVGIYWVVTIEQIPLKI